MRGVKIFLIWVTLFSVHQVFGEHRLHVTNMYLFREGVSVAQGTKCRLRVSYRHIPFPDNYPPSVITAPGINEFYFGFLDNRIIDAMENFDIFQYDQNDEKGFAIDVLKYLLDGNVIQGIFESSYPTKSRDGCPIIGFCSTEGRTHFNSEPFCLDKSLKLDQQFFEITIEEFVLLSNNHLGDIVLVDPSSSAPKPKAIYESSREKNNEPPLIYIQMDDPDYKLFFGIVEAVEDPFNVDYDLLADNEVLEYQKIKISDDEESCDIYNGNENKNKRYYETCEDRDVTLELNYLKQSNYYESIYQQTEPPFDDFKRHDFKVRINPTEDVPESLDFQISDDFQPISTFLDGDVKKVRYEYAFDYLTPEPIDDCPGDEFECHNYRHSDFKIYTVYEVNICEHSICGGGSNTCCKDEELVDFDDERLARTKRFVYKVYKPLTKVKTEKQEPCREFTNPFVMGSEPNSGYNSVFGDYTEFGAIQGDLIDRIGGYEYGKYIVTLYLDTDPLEGFQGTDCDRYWQREVEVNERSLPGDFIFAYLPSGDYKLVIQHVSLGCGSYTEYFNLSTTSVENESITLSVEPNPAFICPVEFGKGLIPSVTLTATTGFTNYEWHYLCGQTPSLLPDETGNTLEVERGLGGLYELRASIDGRCKQKVRVKVIDLNLPAIQYEEIQNVIQNNAVKVEHASTPKLSSISWQNNQQIKNFDKRNSYLSGKSGIYNIKQTFDYLENRSQNLLTHQNVNIKNSGAYNDVAIFNYTHPGFLFCEPNWKLNNTITTFNINSQPIENKDIMGLHSASLYGYGGKLPVAVSQLGKYHEIGFEGFEEYTPGQTINQLNNSSGNIDLVNQYVKGDILYYEEYEVSVAMSNYGIIKMPGGGSCPQTKFTADVLAKSITNLTGNCDGDKSIEAEASDVLIQQIATTCTIPDGFLFEFDPERVPPFVNANNKNCAPWHGIVRTKNYKSYPKNIDLTSRVSIVDTRAHTGEKSMRITSGPVGVQFVNKDIRLETDKEYILSFWVSTASNQDYKSEDLNLFNRNNRISVDIITDSYVSSGNTFYPKGPVINGWQKVEAVFKTGDINSNLTLQFHPSVDIYIDDVRFSPLNASMQSYVYEPATYRLIATLDQNNYATLYRYDAQGNLFLVLKETVEGIKTIQMNQNYLSTNQ